MTRCREMTFSSPLGMVGRVWEGGTGEWSGSLGEARSRRAQLAVELGMNSTVCLPVYGGSELIGVIEAFGRNVENPGDVFLDARSGVGRQVGEYVERKRAEDEIDVAKDEFFALVSHELRTPLTSIIGYLELMQEDSSMAEEEKQHFLGIVHRNADRLLRLVGDLLLVAQVQAGKFALTPGPLDLNAIAHQAVEAAKPIATGRTISLALEDRAGPGLRRRPRPHRPAVRQPDLERAQVHRPRRAGRGADLDQGRARDRRGQQQRLGDPRGRARASVRPLLPRLRRDRRASRRASGSGWRS